MANKSPVPERAKRARGPRRDPRHRLWPWGLRPDWLLLGLLGLSLAIRLWGIHERLPDASLGINVLDDSVIEETDRTTVGRAWEMWRGGTRALDLNPHTGGWPALSFYVTLALQYLYKLYYSVASGGASATQFQKHITGAGWASFFLFARIVGALIGTLTVFLAFRLGVLYLGRGVGLLAGLFVATNPLHALISQHVSDPNLLALLFVLLATPPLLRVAAGPTTRDSIRAGVLIGLAGACKYVPLVLAIPFAIAHAGLWTKETPDRTKRTPFLRKRALWAGMLAIAAAVFVGSPFLFLDWRQTLVDITGQRRALFSDWVGQTGFPISLPAYLAVSIPNAMGWPAYLLGLVGLVLLWRAGRTTRMLALIPITIVLANGVLRVPQERYVLVALPFLHLGASLAIVRAAAWGRTKLPAWTRSATPRLSPALLLSALLAAVAIAWPLPYLVTTRHSLSLPDSRHLSRRWINENLDPNERMAIELYGPVFNDAERAIVTWPFFAMHSQVASPAYHPEFLDGFNYHVASGEISRRFEADLTKYPAENAYYSWLRGHATVVWKSDAGSMSGPQIVIRRLPRGISTRGQRDRIFAAAMPKPSELDRIELWCVDCSRLFARFGDYDRTEEWARRGLKIGVPSMEPQLRCALAIALWYKGQLDSADAEIRVAIRELPRSPEFRAYHGAILTDLSRFEDALAEFRMAFDLSGGDPGIRLSVAQALGQLGRFEEAVRELRQVPPGHPDRALALRDAAGLALNHLKRPAEALDLLRESIQTDPNQQQAAAVREEIARLEAAMSAH